MTVQGPVTSEVDEASVNTRKIGSSMAPGLFSRLKDWANDWIIRQLSKRHVQRFLTHNFLSRATARRDARDLYDICVGFSYSQTLRCCVQLDLFQLLQDNPMGLADLSLHLNIPGQNLQVLLESATALKLLRQRTDQTYAVGRLGTAVLADPGISVIVRHHDLLYRDLAQPVDVLTSPLQSDMAAFWAYTQDDKVGDIDPSLASNYSDVMAATQSTVADLVLGAYDFSKHKRLLDAGCGTGTFAMAVADHYTNLHLTLYDLPPVIDLARSRVEASAQDSTRVTLVPGNFADGSLPADQDIVCLIRVLHDQSDESASALLAKAREALRPGGTILIAETLAGSDAAERIGRVYFGWFLLAMGRGRARSPAQVSQLLRESGFAGVREHSTSLPMIVRVITAQR